MWQNCPFDTLHAMMLVLRGNEIYCESDLIARYSSWMEYLNDCLRIGWTTRMLCMLYKFKWHDLLTRGMCNTMYRVSDNKNDQSFMNLYIYQMHSPFHWGRANWDCKTSWFSSFVSNNLRSDGFSNAGFEFLWTNY